ncbi:MAG: SurA N-terminal domain-containing protein, partial [Rhodospirillales bacterium]|nr:SurA N-terminal domain-containing protein [Rhodospirillales bacterium]
MLQSMRQATKSWASRAVIIVLALSFGAWGINDVFTGGSRSAVATVGEVDVPTVLFDRQFQRALQRERERSGRPDLTRDEAHQAGLTGQVLNLLVREYLLDAEAARLGLRAADVSVMQELEDSPAFSNAQGRFDPELYDLVLERNNMTRAEYEDLIRIDLLRDQILNAVGGDRKVPESLIDAVHRYRAEERSAQLALIPARGMAGLAEPGATDIQAYYEANTASFMAPERRSAVLVQLTAQDMVSEIELSDEDVYAEYEARIDEFDVPERRAVIQINAQDEALIRDGAQRLKEGED